MNLQACRTVYLHISKLPGIGSARIEDYVSSEVERATKYNILTCCVPLSA
jgi:hypothetical protein